MKSLSLIFVTALLCVSLNVHAQTVEAAQQDLVFLAAINKDLKAEKPRYDYAYYLYTKKRFQDSREQLRFLFGVNSSHPGGRKLNKNIDEIDGLADTEYQDQQMRIFMLEKMKMDKDEEVAAANRGGGLSPDRISKIQNELDKRYGFSDRMRLEVKTVEGESKFQAALITAMRANQFSEAEKAARSWVNQFERSPIAKADFGAFLILRDRFTQAEVLLSEAMKKAPDCLKLKIVSDLLKDIKSVKSSERTADLKSRLNDELAVYQLAANGQLEEAKRASSSAQVPDTGMAATRAPAQVAPAQPQSVNGLPPVLTAEDIEKMNVKPSGPPMKRRK